MKVLVVEHDAGVGLVVMGILQEWNMPARLVRSAQDARDALKEQEPDLLVVAMELPDLSGVEWVRRLRATDRYRRTLVLMLANKADKDALFAATNAGIQHMVAKPFAPDELRRKLHVLYYEYRRQTVGLRAQTFWKGRRATFNDVFSPQIVFGEPLHKLADLKVPENRHLLPYLADAGEVVGELNEKYPLLRLEYVIEDNTADFIIPLVLHTAKKWIRLILLSANCPGKPLLLVRLFTINGRAGGMPIVLVYDERGDISRDERRGLRKLGVKTLQRSTLNRDALDRLIRRHIGKKVLRNARSAPEPISDEAPSERELRERLARDVEAMATLPALPQVCRRILELARDPDSDLQDWIRSIQSDPLTCAVVFRHANSPAYGFKGAITEIGRAVILLGKEAIRDIVASQAMRQTFISVKEQGFDLRAFWRHNIAVGYAAYALAFPIDDGLALATQGKRFAELGLDVAEFAAVRAIDLPARLQLDYSREVPFIAGIMHDIGKGALVQAYQGLFPILLKQLEKEQWKMSFLDVEEMVAGGVTHVALGGVVAEHWNLGAELQGVIRNHHRPQDSAFAFLVGVADLFGQVLYPFPRGPENRVAAAVAAGDWQALLPFLPVGFADNKWLQSDELLHLLHAFSPLVKRLSEHMGKSVE
jgi:HD-like signal output (HDOD) protein